MQGVIDADTHIAESESMWKLLDPEFTKQRPVLVSVPDDTLYGDRNAFWLIDGNIFPKPAGKGSYNLITPSAAKVQQRRGDIAISCRELTNVAARLADMDNLEVQTQVIYPTLFLVYITDDAKLETALCRAYNDYLSEAWSKAKERLRWVVVPPLRSIEASLEEIKKGKEHGAVGVFFRGMEGDLTLDNPYFFPVYKLAADLDLPICIHTGSGAPALLSLFDVQRNHTFAHGRVLPLFAFRDIVANRIPELFPGLRFGFVEAAAGWVPFLIHILRRLLRERWSHASAADLFRSYRLFVACEADEDIPYIARYTGEDHLMIGSDYGHNDPSNEARLVTTLRAREDVPPEVTNKILCENPKTFYAV
jgi:predicted TIM-barrel fold metal-dependent hydrolase